MLFNSIDFAIFLPIVFIFYWLLRGHLTLQNICLLISSYIFYGWWDWRFLSLIAFSSFVDYFVGIGLSRYTNANTRKLLLFTSIGVNIGFLAFFKYFNFFIDNFVAAYSLFGSQLSIRSLQIILPVGISFYTFQTLSYSIDVYKNKMAATKNVIAFFAYVSFFPQLVAGPIERATNLLPQFLKDRVFSPVQAADGMRQILWGLFKKIVVADNCALYVNTVFSNYSDYSGSTLFLAAILFAFQIYGDFSGYSDIAIGTSRLFGFSLMRNFAFPYFSRDIAEFWRRWHISLSTWFRDYIYIPIGGSRGSNWKKVRNTLVIFLVSGFWHGANWTFIAWGLINALYFLPLLLLDRNRVNTNVPGERTLLPSAKEFFNIGFTFVLTVFAWIFFRSDSIVDALQYISIIFSTSMLSAVSVVPYETIVFISILLFVEWIQREKQHGLQLGSLSMTRPLRWGIYYGLVFTIILFGGSQQSFIYFQF